MKTKDIFARALGGAAGVGAAVLLPHLGCLGTLTVAFIGAGAGAETAQNAAYVGGAGMLVAGGGAALYGMRPSSAFCCLLWGETPRVRAAKAFAVAVAGFTAAGVANTLLDRGPGNEARTAAYLVWARDAGQPLWGALDQICRPAVRP